MNQKRAFSVLFLFLFGILTLGIVSASPLTDLLEKIPGFNGAKLVDYFGGINLLPSLLLAGLLLLIVYSIMEFVPFLGKTPGVRWSVSVIVSLLGFWYIDYDLVSGILMNYHILGVVLTSIVPLLIIVVFCVQLEKENKAVAAFVNPPLILFLIIYSFSKYLSLGINSSGETQELAWLYLLTSELSLIFFIFRKKIVNWYNKLTFRITDAEAKANLSLEISLKIRDLQDRLQYTKDRAEINRINKEISRLKGVLASL